MNTEEISKKAEAIGPWYHEIKLSKDYTTPSYMVKQFPSFPRVWDMIRAVRNTLDYSGRSVLDLGTMDGMWAFEAETLKAALVVATDIWDNPRLHFAKATINSDILIENPKSVELLTGQEKFDIIQCLGLLYHIENPMLALRRIVASLNPAGVVLLETACWRGSKEVPAMRLNRDPFVYGDDTTYWLPNWLCLLNMIHLAGMSVVHPTLMRVREAETERICIICQPQT